jgi:hypothetical protein
MLNPTTFFCDDRQQARLTAVLDVSGAVLRAAVPVVDLLVRLFLANSHRGCSLAATCRFPHGLADDRRSS